MDRTSRIAVFICAALLFALFIYTTPPPKPAVPVTAPASAAMASATANGAAVQAIKPPAAPMPSTAVPEKLTLIENAAMKLTFTSAGATIKEVELKQHQDEKTGNIVLNENAHSNILELTGWPGADTANFELVEIPNGVSYVTTLPGGVKWERSYTFGKNSENDSGMSGYLRVLFHKIARHLGQPEIMPLVYTLDVNDRLTNTGATDVTLPAYSLSVGRAQPLRVGGHYQPISNMYLGSGWLANKFHLTTVSDFNPSSFLWIVPTRSARSMFSSKEADESTLRWLGVENQFFAVLLTPGADHSIQHADFQCYNDREPSGSVPSTAEPDIEAAGFFPEVKIPAGQSVTLSYGLYAGPKDFNKLDALGANQGELMNYGWFELLIVPMLTVLKFWYLLLHNYGVAIILLTLMIKAITWPLQSIANHSGKRMQALAPKLKELQAKHKDHPEKLQTETFALYKEYGVNPFGGCLPALIQMPVFFSLYYMLQNAVELRGQSFLWVHDLTQPDNVYTLSLLGQHLGIHPLPIMVTGLTMVMMRMTPQIGDPQQAKIAQIMPLVFLFIFYNFAAALSLYYVINNCVSIIQIYRNLRKPLPELKRVPKKKTA